MDNDNIINLKAVTGNKEQPSGPTAKTFAVYLADGSRAQHTGFLHFSEMFISISEDENGFLIPIAIYKTNDVSNVQRVVE